jgi:hypothetical protein
MFSVYVVGAFLATFWACGFAEPVFHIKPCDAVTISITAELCIWNALDTSGAAYWTMIAKVINANYTF